MKTGLIGMIVVGVVLAGLAVASVQAQETDRVKENVTSILSERHQAILKNLEDRHAGLLLKQTERKAEREEKRGEREKKHLEFKEEVAKRLDAHQQEVAERVSQNIDHMHERRCEHYDKYLDHLSRILGKVETRAAELKDKGTNVASVEAAVTVAEGKISAAQTAVNTLCAKDYVVTVGTDEKIGEALRATIKLLHEDHRALWKGALHEAWEAVHAALRELARAHGESPSPTPSTSPTPIVTVSPVI